MKTLLTLAGLILSNPALAASGSFYDYGNLVYLHSGMPGPARLLGWYSGRCASVSQPNRKIAALLTTYRSGAVLKSVFWSEPDKPENYFDRLTPELIREIETGLKQYDPDIPPLVPRVDHWEAVHLGAHKDATKTRASRALIAVQALHDDVQTRACLFRDRVH